MRTGTPLNASEVQVGTTITETHRYDLGSTMFLPCPVVDDPRCHISWRCVGQTLIQEVDRTWLAVVTWQCEAVEWVGADHGRDLARVYAHGTAQGPQGPCLL